MVNQVSENPENHEKLNWNNEELNNAKDVSRLQSKLKMIFQEKNPENPKSHFTSTRWWNEQQRDYEYALSHAQPENKWLWYREVFTEKLMTKEQQNEFIQVLRDAIELKNYELVQEIVKTAFRYLWTKMWTWLSNEEIEEIVNSLDSFSSPFIVPVEKVWEDWIYLINESTWPTDAFKDLALQQVTTMLSVITKKKNNLAIDKALDEKNQWISYEFKTINWEEKLIKYKNWVEEKEQWNRPKISIVITLTSTSWDTWPAWWAWIEWRDFVANIIWFPAFEATQWQVWQMLNLKWNVLSVPFKQAFTAIQEDMKKCNNPEFKANLQKILEEKFKELRKEYGFDIEVSSWSFNSVNIWRIDWQSIYHSVALMVAKAQNPEITWDVIEVIPSWNFWHTTGALQAKDMMWWIDDIIVSTNENDAIYKLIKTWEYKMAETEISCPSVSMIIRYGSNVERLLRMITSPERCAELMEKFENWWIKLTKEEHQKLKDLWLKTYKVNIDWELATIRDLWLNHDRLICPHTANAYHASIQHKLTYPDVKNTILVSETASPWKFLAATAVALTYDFPKKMAFEYEKLRKIENTNEWKEKLLKMITDAYAKHWKIFDENMIPQDLREIYKKWINMWEVQDSKDFWDLTLKFVDNIWDMFTQQTKNIINRKKAN